MRELEGLEGLEAEVPSRLLEGSGLLGGVLSTCRPVASTGLSRFF